MLKWRNNGSWNEGGLLILTYVHSFCQLPMRCKASHPRPLSIWIPATSFLERQHFYSTDLNIFAAHIRSLRNPLVKKELFCVMEWREQERGSTASSSRSAVPDRHMFVQRVTWQRSYRPAAKHYPLIYKVPQRLLIVALLRLLFGHQLSCLCGNWRCNLQSTGGPIKLGLMCCCVISSTILVPWYLQAER
jgi:hypothetical protein